MSEENVKVAVRVRPFNKREKARNAKCCVEMKGNQTIVHDPENPNAEPKMFAFDYSYWSFDGGKERSDGYWEPDPSHERSGQYCDQTKCFNDLGEGILKNAWDGYNSTLFAYGQTGSGKSYSVVGYGINKGIVPLFCEKIFAQIEEKKGGAEGNFEVTFSMLEIYNEIVRDLLNPSAGSKKNGLKVRQHKKKGFYAEKLTVVPVDSYAAIKEKMDEGTTNRTIAATNMNATSSRAHTIVCINFVQKKKNKAGQEMAKSSVTNLVDLAGSERVANTGATGDRLKEGAAINMSLTSLGNCISALADNSNGKKVRVPYRDSKLTKLLMNALGGNSKTIMIAAISPADINYEESISTLRYADRAKQIKTKAVVNEDPTEKLIRELQEENERLKAAMKGKRASGFDAKGGGTSKELEEQYKAEMEENEREMEEMRKSYEERLAAAQTSTTFAGSKSHADIVKQKAKLPHLYNLNMDPQLNGTLVHLVKSGKYKVGNQKGTKSDIVLMGPSILEQHAVIQSSKDHLQVTISKANEKARILVNGQPITEKSELHHNDRILLGTTQLYVFANPIEEKQSPSDSQMEISWETAQEEIAGSSGFDMDHREDRSEAEIKLQEDLIEVMPAVEEANSISESLDKMCKFEMVMVAKEQLGLPGGGSEVFVRLRNFANGMTYEWPKDKFMNRFIKMQELYEDVEEGEVDLHRLKDSEDPFTEPIDLPSRIGSCSVHLKSLAYMIDMKSQLEVTDFRGNEVGLLDVELVPCDSSGKEYGAKSEVWVDNPRDLITKDVHFAFKIHQAYGLPPRFTDVRARYTFYKDPDFVESDVAKDISNPVFKHKRTFSFKPCTLESLEYLLEDRILVQLFGVQMPLQRNSRDSRNTASLLAADALSKGMVSAANNNQKVVDVGKMKSNMEAAVLKKRQEKLEVKVKCLREMITEGEKRGMKEVPLSYVKGVLDAPTAEVLEKWNRMYDEYRPNGLSKPHSAGSNPNRIKSSSACVVM